MIASIVIFFIIFGVLVTSHEFGHFIIAKSGGIRVNEFFVGMGPTIWKKQKGDTLYGIAKKYNTSVQAIKNDNNLQNDRLYIGQSLKINTSGKEPLECIVYTVKKGDTLYSIAKK